METLILGIGSSLASELVTWLNKKLSGSFLQGYGAWIISALIAFLFSFIKVVVTTSSTGGFLASIGPNFIQIFGMSQIYFNTIAKMFNLKVAPDIAPVSE